MTEYEYTNPTVAVPVAAVNLINKVASVLGEAMVVTVMEQEIAGDGFLEDAWVCVGWVDSVPQDLMNRDILTVDLRSDHRPTLRLSPHALAEIRRAQGLETVENEL